MKLKESALLGEITLTKEHQDSLISLLSFIKTADEENMIKLMHVFGFILQKTIFDNKEKNNLIENFKYGKIHALVIRNFPIEKNLPPTPYTGFCPIDLIKLSASISFGMMGVLDLTPVTYYGENDNLLVRHVVPKTDAVDDMSSHGSKLSFGFHVDNPDLPLISEKKSSLSACPEYLSLQAIRHDHKVPTKLLFLDDIMKLIPESIVKTLCEPIFTIKRPDSFVGMSVKAENLPILSYDDQFGIVSRFDRNNVQAINKTAVNALEYFVKTIDDAKMEHELIMKPGDYVIFHNQKTLHARDSFQPKLDGTDRWLIRLFGLKNLAKTIPLYNHIPYLLKA